MKKLVSILLATALTLSMSLTTFAQGLNTDPVSTERKQTMYTTPYSGIDVELKDGETVKIPLKLLNTTKVQTISSPLDAGFVSVTRQGTRVNFVITFFVAYTTTTGLATITDITSGLSCGSTPVYTRNGYAISSGLSGHMYRFALVGYAYMLGTPVAEFEAVAQWTH